MEQWEKDLRKELNITPEWIYWMGMVVGITFLVIWRIITW